MTEEFAVAPAPPLMSIILRLRSAGLEISTREFLEGIEALHALPEPFDYLTPVSHAPAGTGNTDRLVARDRLIWLVQTLWARSAEERRIVRDVLERDIPAPKPELALTLSDLYRGRNSLNLTPTEPESTPKPPKTDDELETASTEQETEATTSAESNMHSDSQTTETNTGPKVPAPAIEDTDLEEGDTYVMEPASMISPLWLTSVWRRFQEPTYVEDRTTLDLNKTVSNTVDAGGLVTPAFSLRRVNKARLFVLIDSSAAMAPWQMVSNMFMNTLDPSVSRFDHLTLRFFSGAPGKRVFAHPDLRRPRLLNKDLTSHEGDGVLVFGEAGAVRAPRVNFENRLNTFVTSALQNSVRPIVWVNPMPPAYWRSDFSSMPTRFPGVHIESLSGEGLLKAVDYLRGQGG